MLNTTELTFPAGSQLGDRQCVNIPIIDDTAVEYSGELLYVFLTTSDSRLGVSRICNRASVRIYDNDCEYCLSIHWSHSILNHILC